MIAELERCFPELRVVGYQETSPESARYNCVAWAMGDTSRWWWPDPHPYAYWPHEPRVCSLEAFTREFESMGYQVSRSREVEISFEKIAIYVKEDDLPTHVARQLPSGVWTSKCGGLHDITHVLHALEGDTYGQAKVIMKRQIPAQKDAPAS